MLARTMRKKADLPACPHLLPLVITDRAHFLSVKCTPHTIEDACDTCKSWDQQSMINILQLIKQNCQVNDNYTLLLIFPISNTFFVYFNMYDCPAEVIITSNYKARLQE